MNHSIIGFSAEECQIYESRLRDTLVLFMGDVSSNLTLDTMNSRTEGIRIILRCFTEALSRLFITTQLLILWEEGDKKICIRYDIVEKDFEITDIHDEATITEFINMKCPMQEYTPLLIGSLTERNRRQALCLSLNSESITSGQKLWIVMESANNLPKIWAWFIKYIPGLKSVMLSLDALLKAQKVVKERNQVQKLIHIVDKLRNSRNLNTKERLVRSSKLLETISKTNPVRFLKEVTNIFIWNLQEILSTGWNNDIVPTGGISLKYKDNYHEYLNTLTETTSLLSQIASYSMHAAYRSIGTFQDSQDDKQFRYLHRVKNVANCFHALLNPFSSFDHGISRCESERLLDKDKLLSILPLWIRIHELHKRLRRLPVDTQDKISERAWDETVEATLIPLAEYLQKIGNTKPKEEKSLFSALNFQCLTEDADLITKEGEKSPSSALNFLYLWFCLKLLYEEKEKMNGKNRRTPLIGEKIIFRSELAYVMREAVRFACFGHRNDYFFHRVSFIMALSTLVEYHAHWVVKLPMEYNLRRLFNRIIEDTVRKSSLRAEEHLQHVLDVYLAGFFLLWFRVPQNEDEPFLTLLDMLAGASAFVKPGDRMIREFLSSYCLSALFHDIGHLLFPIDIEAGKNLYRNELKIKPTFNDVKEKIKDARTTIVNRSIEDLKAGNYFELESEPQIEQWFNRQIETGEPDHGLLSAWYLHGICNDLAGDSKEILRKAVRAILLHNAFTVRIDAEKDPVASLLVLCDELFEWEQFRYVKPIPKYINRFLQVMKTGAAQSESRYRWIGCGSHEFDIIGGKLVGKLKAPDENEKGWPQIHFILRHPRYLNVPSFVIWLMKAQNLGRIIPSKKNGWGPTIIVRGDIETIHGQKGISTRKTLELIAQHSDLPIRPDLVRWLSDKEVFPEGEYGQGEKEEVRLGYLEYPLCREDIRLWLSELESESLQLLQDLNVFGQRG